MKTYNYYEAAKIENPQGVIYEFEGCFSLFKGIDSKECNPAGHCMTVEQFLKDGHKFVEGDLIINVNGAVNEVRNDEGEIFNKSGISELNNERYILRSAALENQMNIDNLATQTPEEKEALDLIDTTPHQYEMSKFSGNEWNGEGLPPVGVECEYKDGDDWYEVKVNYLSEWFIVIEALKSQSKWIDIKGTEISFDHSRFDDLKFRKPESPQQREDRERLEAAYDLYLTRHIDMSAPYHYDEFLKNKFTLDGFLAIVDKTNYRKESN